MKRLLIISALLCVVSAAFAATPSRVPAVKPAGAPVIKNAIAAQRGHVVVVNFWATWCGPCVAEFPALVKLSNNYRSRGLVVFAVSADSDRDIQSKVKPFLVKQKADFPQYLQQADDPEDMINAFDPKWGGDLPKTFIYDRQGRLVKELSGEQTEKTFAAAIKPYLAK